MATRQEKRPAGRKTAKRGRRALPATMLYLRVDFGEHGALGPGKTRLMELIAETGSISAAGRAMGMSYRRAWLLVDSLNIAFREPLVAKQTGAAAWRCRADAARPRGGPALPAHRAARCFRRPRRPRGADGRAGPRKGSDPRRNVSAE